MARTKKTKTSEAKINVRNLVAVKITIHSWGGQAIDRQAGESIEKMHGAEADTVRAMVLLLPKSWCKRINSAASRLRAQWDAMSLPWEDGGWRVIHAARYEAVMEGAGERILEYQRMADELVRAYPRLCKEAEKRLGGLYDENAFPTTREVERMFGADVYQRPIVAGADVRVQGLSEHAVDTMRQSIEEQLAEQINTALAALVNQLRNLLTDALERYDKDDQKRVRYSGLQTRVAKTCDTMQALNVTGSPKVDALIESVREVLTKVDPSTLREDTDKKNKAKKETKSVLKDLDSFGL